MKLTLHSFDFEEETVTFRVPKNVLLSNSFGAVPEGVDVDLAPVTGNAALGIKVLPTTDAQQLKAAIILLDKLLAWDNGDIPGCVNMVDAVISEWRKIKAAV